VYSACVLQATYLGCAEAHNNLPDAETIARLSDIISSSAVLGTLRRSDTFFAFVLRAIRRVLADHSQTDRQVITSLWSIFDDPDLNGALDIPQKSPMAIVPRKPNKPVDFRS
jgi:hypothetical protein